MSNVEIKNTLLKSEVYYFQRGYSTLDYFKEMAFVFPYNAGAVTIIVHHNISYMRIVRSTQHILQFTMGMSFLWMMYYMVNIHSSRLSKFR